jgi:nitroimidazol reductase NimA-like FMN-containing flavoprotein (pyridoxamine 5'-phosphate oxidase superfamily)
VGPQLEVLSQEVCLARLRSHTIGRVAFVADDGVPLAIPVNYRLVESSGRTWIAIRTRPGNVLDRAETFVAFEIDEIDQLHREGWSVVARGTLHHISPDVAAFRERFDPDPWLVDERDAWLIIEPFGITGRVLHAPEGRWAFDTAAYL